MSIFGFAAKLGSVRAKSCGFDSHALHFSECATFTLRSSFLPSVIEVWNIPGQNEAGFPPNHQFCETEQPPITFWIMK